ncbi:MAG: ABC transporter permease subunit [Lachnospiraceae bacterium]|jgi:ABC-type transport system involved in multi-copper enzyme maturation permease subunit|nr:ABC transporter permease subunit [Lachnospiraceae bacterium]
MLKLIKLEWKKNNIRKYILGSVIMAALLCVFLFALAFLGIANDPDGTLDAAPGMDVISAPIELFTSMVFLIHTSVMLASFIVSAYKNKTMNLMFSYPIKRQKILASQMIAVWLFNFVALIITKFLIYLCVSVGAEYMQPSFAIDFNLGSLTFYIQLILKAFVVVSMSFIALFVGMAMKSSKATIVTSFLLIFLTQANVGDITMQDSAAFPIVLTAISFAFAVLSIYNVEKKDLL